MQRLREHGWIEGRTVAIEYRWAEGRSERYVEIAAEFVRLKVDVIVTPGGATLAAKQATAAIPTSSRRRRTRLVSASLRHWRDRTATSPACRASSPISLASGSSFSGRFSPVSAGWQL